MYCVCISRLNNVLIAQSARRRECLKEASSNEEGKDVEKLEKTRRDMGSDRSFNSIFT